MSSPKPILFTSILLILGWALAGCRGTTSDAGPTAANTGGTAGEGAAGGSGTQIVTGPCDNYDGTPSELADLQGDAAITIDFAGSRAPLEHFWRATGFTPASQLQDKSMVQTQQRLGTVHQNGTLYTRPHYLLNLITMGELGTASYDFSKLDTALDVLVQNDQRLIFEVMGNPSERFTNFESDAQVRAFKALVVAMVTHLIERYGSEVVRSWYFEVWNEPEASLFWPYSTQGLLNYYDAVSEALLEVDPTLKWGGPGTSGSLPAQLKAVLAHCDTGTNYFTGENGVRIDFISVHVKDLPHRAAERMRDYHSYIADNHPRLADTPFINDEADPMIGWHRSFWWRGHPWYAAYVAQSAHVHLDHVVDPLGIESPIQSNDNGFIGGWGQRTQFTRYYRYNGFSLIKKPVQSVLSLMALLGNQRLTEVNLPSPYDQHLGLLATTRGDESVALLAYHRPDIGNYQEATYPEITNHDAAPVSLVVDLENLPVKAGRIVHFRLDEQHGNPYQAFLAEGAPENPTSEQIALMRAQQEPVVLETPKDYLACDGRVRLKIELPPSSVSVIMLAKQAPVLPRVENLTVTQYWGFAGQREMLLTWSNVDSRTLLSYEVLHTPADGGESRRVNAQDLLDASYTLVDPEPGQYLPEHPVAREPSICLLERCGLKRAAVHPAVDGPRHKPRALEHAQMLGHRRQRHGERLGEIADLGRFAARARQQGSARAIRERTEHEIESIFARATTSRGPPSAFATFRALYGRNNTLSRQPFGLVSSPRAQTALLHEMSEPSESPTSEASAPADRLASSDSPADPDAQTRADLRSRGRSHLAWHRYARPGSRKARRVRRQLLKRSHAIRSALLPVP